MKPTLSIGIIAYNEAANIGRLLTKLLEQKIKTVDLIEIIVASDCSDDGTDEIVKSIPDGRIRLIRHTTRLGASGGLNTIQNNAKGDILINFDADVLPLDEKLIDTLVEPLLNDSSVGLVSAALVPAKPNTFVEKVLARNHIFKESFFRSVKDGSSVYTCYGPVRALARRLYTSFRYTDHCPYDSYSYFMCMRIGMKFVSSANARVLFRCPERIADHVKQSTRFASGRESIIKEFGEGAVASYFIPRGALGVALAKEFVFHPILFVGFTYLMAKVRFSTKGVFHARWEIATSSKRL